MTDGSRDVVRWVGVQIARVAGLTGFALLVYVAYMVAIHEHWSVGVAFVVLMVLQGAQFLMGRDRDEVVTEIVEHLRAPRGGQQ